MFYSVVLLILIVPLDFYLSKLPMCLGIPGLKGKGPGNHLHSTLSRNHPYSKIRIHTSSLQEPSFKSFPSLLPRRTCHLGLLNVFHIWIPNISLIANHYLEQQGRIWLRLCSPLLLSTHPTRLKYRLSQTSALSSQSPQTFQTLYSCKWRRGSRLLSQMAKDGLYHTDISKSRNWSFCLQLSAAAVFLISSGNNCTLFRYLWIWSSYNFTDFWSHKAFLFLSPFCIQTIYHINILSPMFRLSVLLLYTPMFTFTNSPLPFLYIYNRPLHPSLHVRPVCTQIHSWEFL